MGSTSPLITKKPFGSCLQPLIAESHGPRRTWHVYMRKDWGVPEDRSEAIRLYQLAAEAGEFFAQVAMGRIYSQGAWVPVSSIAALKWYTAAATQAGIAECEELREAKAYVASMT